MKKSIFTIILVLILIIIALPIYAQNNNENVKAKIIKDNGVEEKKIEESGTTKKIQNVIIKILNGEFESEEYEMQYILSSDINSNIYSKRELEEKNIILIDIEQEEGEIKNISYRGMANQNYELYFIALVCLVCILVITGRKAIGTVLKYLIIISLVCYIFVISIKQQINLILISSILSFVITIFIDITTNKLNKKSILVMLCSMLVICFTWIIVYILFDIINLVDPMLNIQISNISINIKDLLCSFVILFSCGICNSLANTYIIHLLTNEDKTTYKTKSQNIIEGQRSLKL